MKSKIKYTRISSPFFYVAHGVKSRSASFGYDLTLLVCTGDLAFTTTDCGSTEDSLVEFICDDVVVWQELIEVTDGFAVLFSRLFKTRLIFEPSVNL